MRYLDFDTGKKISKIGLGTSQFWSKEWGYGELYAGRAAYVIVRCALELAVTLFDTAEIYGSGRSERILGRALGENRESVFLATKISPIVPGAPLVKQRAMARANHPSVAAIPSHPTLSSLRATLPPPTSNSLTTSTKSCTRCQPHTALPLSTTHPLTVTCPS